MYKKRKVTNYYKLLLLLTSYHNSFSLTEGSPKLNNMLARKPIVSKLIRADYFSDIDDTTLYTLHKIVKSCFNRPEDSFEYIQYICEETVGEWKSLIPKNDIELLKVLGLKKPFSSSTKDSEEVGLINVFKSKNFMV